MLPRQCGGDTGVICCTLSVTTTSSDCEFDTKSLFENAKKTMMFKIYQIDNFNKKFTRLKGAMRVIKGKGSKQDEFTNTTDILLRALGGDKSNPLCAGRSTQTKSLRDAVTTLEELGNCSAVINQSCYVNETQMGIDMDGFNECDQRNIELLNKADNAMDEPDETAKCLLWKEAAGMVDDLRTKYKVLNQTCYNAMNVASKATATEKGLKGSCIAEFIKCKKAQDRAISVINACSNEDTIIIGNFRSLLTEMEDDYDEDYDEDYAGEFAWLHDMDYD